MKVISMSNNFTIHQTAEILGIPQIQNAKFSNLIMSQLQYGLNTGQIDSQKVVDQIHRIQNNTIPRAKGVRQFKGDILSGFHYCHWFETRFMGQNLLNHWKLQAAKSEKFETMFKDACRQVGVNEGDYISEQAIAVMSHNFVNGFFERSESGKLTGEWIIFAKDNDLNVYLTLAGHKEEDHDIFLRMATACRADSPELFPKDVLKKCLELRASQQNSISE